MKSLTDMLDALRQALATLDAVQRGKAVDIVQWEYEELRHIFALLVLGSATGMPTPPPEIGLGLLPLMEEELRMMLDRMETAHTPLSKLFSSLSVG
ncbi:MAG: hypothetical protein M5R41_04610 [Bacteroidia bacterium]|nr:hypothetical protein [Bacteroidia bacterium]